MVFGRLWQLLRCARRRAGADHEEIVARWRAILRHLRRLRRLQRLFGYIGQHLQLYPDRLRARLRVVYPTALDEQQRRRGYRRQYP